MNIQQKTHLMNLKISLGEAREYTQLGQKYFLIYLIIFLFLKITNLISITWQAMFAPIWLWFFCVVFLFTWTELMKFLSVRKKPKKPISQSRAQPCQQRRRKVRAISIEDHIMRFAAVEEIETLKSMRQRKVNK